MTLTKVYTAVTTHEQQVVEEVGAAALLGTIGQWHGAAEDAAAHHLKDRMRVTVSSTQHNNTSNYTERKTQRQLITDNRTLNCSRNISTNISNIAKV